MKLLAEIAKELAPNGIPSLRVRFGRGIFGGNRGAGVLSVPEMETLDDGGFGINQRFIANPLAYRTYAQAGSGYNAPPVGLLTAVAWIQAIFLAVTAE